MVLGAAAALLANVFFATGFVLKKRALAKLPPLRAGEPGRLVRLLAGSPLWLLGLLSLLLGLAAQMRAYQTLPIAVAQGIFVSGMVLLLLLAPLLLGERPTRRDRWGAAAVVAALGMIVGSLAEGQDTVGAGARTGSLLAVCLPALATGLVVFAAVTVGSRGRHRSEAGGGAAYGTALGLIYGVMALAIKGLSGLVADSELAGVADLATAAATTPYLYLLLFTGAAGLALSQMALQRSTASLFVPVCTIVTSVFSTTSGTAVFGERLPDSPLLQGLRVGGLVLGAAAVLILSRRDAAPPPADLTSARTPTPTPVPSPISSRTLSVTVPSTYRPRPVPTSVTAPAPTPAPTPTPIPIPTPHTAPAVRATATRRTAP